MSETDCRVVWWTSGEPLQSARDLRRTFTVKINFAITWRALLKGLVTFATRCTGTATNNSWEKDLDKEMSKTSSLVTSFKHSSRKLLAVTQLRSMLKFLRCPLSLCGSTLWPMLTVPTAQLCERLFDAVSHCLSVFPSGTDSSSLQ